MDGTARTIASARLQQATDRGHRVLSIRYLTSGSLGHSTVPGPRLSEHSGLANVQRGSADGDGSHDRPIGCDLSVRCRVFYAIFRVG